MDLCIPNPQPEIWSEGRGHQPVPQSGKISYNGALRPSDKPEVQGNQHVTVLRQRLVLMQLLDRGNEDSTGVNRVFIRSKTLRVITVSQPVPSIMVKTLVYSFRGRKTTNSERDPRSCGAKKDPQTQGDLSHGGWVGFEAFEPPPSRSSFSTWRNPRWRWMSRTCF